MKTIIVSTEGATANLTVRAATVADDMRLSMLVAQVLENPLPDRAEQTVAVVVFPKCAACTTGTLTTSPDVECSARDLTAAEFVNLPAAIGKAWFDAVRELNPQWFQREEEPAEQEKKA